MKATYSVLSRLKGKLNQEMMLVKIYFEALHKTEGWQVAMAFKRELESMFPDRDPLYVEMPVSQLGFIKRKVKSELAVSLMTEANEKYHKFESLY
jgi:hypothetical protein